METMLIESPQIFYKSDFKPQKDITVLSYDTLIRYKKDFFAKGNVSRRIVREFTPEEQDITDEGMTVDDFFRW
ncbi:MAG: hypothetical protein LBN23_02455 [Paludibacter sp.]|jgi:hypothetical protein|nr:hypothetical protein [Paludibacter sp.]